MIEINDVTDKFFSSEEPVVEESWLQKAAKEKRAKAMTESKHPVREAVNLETATDRTVARLKASQAKLEDEVSHNVDNVEEDLDLAKLEASLDLDDWSDSLLDDYKVGDNNLQEDIDADFDYDSEVDKLDLTKLLNDLRVKIQKDNDLKVLLQALLAEDDSALKALVADHKIEDIDSVKKEFSSLI